MVSRVWCKDLVKERISAVQNRKGDEDGQNQVTAAAPAVLDLLSAYAQGN